MKRKVWFGVIAVLALASCTQASPTQPVGTKEITPETPQVPTPLPSAVRTLVPATEAAPAATAYPIPSQATPTQVGYPYPAVLPAPGMTATAAAAQPGAAAFHDCARTPGLASCAAQNEAIQARLAFFDASANRLVGLDLENGQGWQAPLPTGQAPAWLSWSIGGANDSQLLVSMGNQQYAVFSSAGALLDTFKSDTPPAWQPDGTLSRDGTFISKAGAQARLEYTQDMRWLLHIRTAQGEQRSLPLDSNPGDMLYVLRGWAPGGQALLAQSYFASNQAMTQGGQLILIDADTGAIQALKASMALSDMPGAGFAWDPIQPELLAFLETSENSVLAPRLALLDLTTGQLSFPLPEGPPVNGLAWNPDGRLAFAVGQVATAASPAAQNGGYGPGIHLLDPQTGKVTPLVDTPQGAADAWPQWSADGQVLVYARAISGSGGGLLVQVRARRVSDGAEWVLVEGLPASEPAVEPAFARRLLAFVQK